MAAARGLPPAAMLPLLVLIGLCCGPATAAAEERDAAPDGPHPVSAAEAPRPLAAAPPGQAIVPADVAAPLPTAPPGQASVPAEVAAPLLSAPPGQASVPAEMAAPVDETIAPAEMAAPAAAAPVDEAIAPAEMAAPAAAAPVDEAIAPAEMAAPAAADETPAPAGIAVPADETSAPAEMTAPAAAAPVDETIAPVEEAAPAIAAPGETAAPVAEEEDRAAASAITWNGYLKNETAFRYIEPRSFTKVRNSISLTGNYSFSPRYSLTATGLAYYDMIYDLVDYDTVVARQTRNADQPLAFLFNLGKEKDSSDADIRELYLDVSLENTDIRVGRQFVVWGLLEGVRIVDEINPIDFRELILPDLLDYRIPLWMLKVEHYRNEGTYQLLWIPDLRFHKPAAPGSEWELLQRVPGTTFPETSLENSEIGLRFSTNLWDTDLTLSYFYTWDDFPVIFRHIILDQVTIEPDFNPTYTRMSMYGGTLSRQAGPFILKGEFAYVTGKYFAVLDIDRDGDGVLDSEGEFQRDHIRWGFGVEFSWGGMDIAPGVTQWIVLDYDPALIQDEYDTSINLFLRKEFPQKSMLFELLVIDFVNLHELYINPEWTYSITDRVQFSVGFDIMGGAKSQFGVLSSPVGQPTVIDQRSQFVGNFHDNDRIYFEFKYSF